MDKKTFTIFPSPSQNGLHLALNARVLGERLGYNVQVLDAQDSLEFRLACVRSDAVLIDLSIEPGWERMYGILTDEHNSLDHVLIVSRTFLPMNVNGMRTGGAPPYPFPFEPIPGFSWSNTDILAWLERQLLVLRGVDAEPRIREEITVSPDGDASFVIEKLIRMIRDSQQRRRKEEAEKITVFLSYRGSHYPQVKALAERIRNGEWHPGKKPDVVLLTPGQLAFDRELLTELRRWQILGMLEELVESADELWVYHTPDYYDSWWTVGELICTTYANYATWEKGRSWIPGPQVRVFNPSANAVSDGQAIKYAIPAGEALRRQMDRMMSIAHTREKGLAKLGPARLLSRIYPLFYHLGLGRLFTRKLGDQIDNAQKATRAHIPVEDRPGIVESQQEYLDYWSNPDELYFQLKNPLLRSSAWNRYAVEWGEGLVDTAAGTVDIGRFFDCEERLRRAVPLEKIAGATREPLMLSSGARLKAEARPPRLLWQGAQSEQEGPKLVEVPVFVGVEG